MTPNQEIESINRAAAHMIATLDHMQTTLGLCLALMAVTMALTIMVLLVGLSTERN